MKEDNAVALPEVEMMLPVKQPKRNLELALLLERLCTNPQEIMEVKFDGYRCPVFFENRKARLGTKIGKTHLRFPDVQQGIENFLLSMGIQDIIFDGELACPAVGDRTNFGDLHLRRRSPSLYVFDLLYFEGNDLRLYPLIERKEYLRRLWPALAPSGWFRWVDQFTEPATKVQKFLDLCEQDCEGGVFKHSQSIYGDTRHPWRKVKNPHYTGEKERIKSFGWEYKAKP